MDTAAVGTLLLYVPNFLCSLLVMGLVPLALGTAGLLVPVAWLLSGILVFWRRAESFIAHRLMKVRRPTPDERARLEPAWCAVTARAGVHMDSYELWVEDSNDLNASTATGHILCTTRFALRHLPDGELAAVLAHELGHHVGGHSWSALLGQWYAVPGQLVWRGVRTAAARFLRASGLFVTGLVVPALAVLAVMMADALYGLPFLLLATPYLIAYVRRRGVLRADRHAAALGFGTMLVAALERSQHGERTGLNELVTESGRTGKEKGALHRLLAAHPGPRTRIHHLVPFLETAG
ncbi:M48 family metalloprotease [Streptomyces sulfonofaciens]|nr:M48 family metalloprotease [Streptomyces sulfonofaciens]